MVRFFSLMEIAMLGFVPGQIGIWRFWNLGTRTLRGHSVKAQTPWKLRGVEARGFDTMRLVLNQVDIENLGCFPER